MKKKCMKVIILGLIFCFLMAGCGHADMEPGEMAANNLNDPEQAEEAAEAEQAETEHMEAEQTEREQEAESERDRTELKSTAELSPGQADAAAGLSPEQTDAYEQMALYIQEGFRVYRITENYQAYFGPIEKLEEESFVCDILLEGADILWSERIAYTLEGSGWYTFSGQYEPVFSKDFSRATKEDSDWAMELKENYQYKVPITERMDMPTAVHYYSEGGPVERDGWKSIPFGEKSSGYGYYIQPNLYTYQDERLDIDIVIEYPQISLSDDAAEERANEILRNAFFYGYDIDGEDRLISERKVCTSICRTYLITREDERYLSMRIYEDNYTRGANHPNEWETGITIDLQTGEALRLEDVTGKDRTVGSLLESGAFAVLVSWEGESTQDWINRMDRTEGEPLSDFDPYFYLTDDGIGLITFAGRYYNCLEASFEALGIDGI
ncbi:MAG: hypothetical protein K2P59_01095 [Acetatifactor sp.]|nr:hypothetical protein [Acetatifactor sp.]